MVSAAVLKLYFFGTVLTVFAVLFAMVDSVGGLMYVQDPHYMMEVDQQTRPSPLPSGGHRRGSTMTKNIGS